MYVFKKNTYNVYIYQKFIKNRKKVKIKVQGIFVDIL